MKQLLASFWWWTRVVVLVAVGVYALGLLWNNSSQQARIWYWPGREEQTSIIALALASFLCGGLMMTIGWALFTASVNYRRTRAARRKRAAIQQREEMEKKAAMLRTKPAPTPIARTKPVATPATSTVATPPAKPPVESRTMVESSAAARDPVAAVEPVPEASTALPPVVIDLPREKPVTRPTSVVVTSTVGVTSNTKPAEATHVVASRIEPSVFAGSEAVPVAVKPVEVIEIEPVKPITPPDAPVSPPAAPKTIT